MFLFRAFHRSTWYLLPLVLLLFSCAEKELEEEDLDFPQKFIGTYKGTAQENYLDTKSGTQIDTAYTNVLVTIGRNPEEDSQVYVTVELPTGRIQNYIKVDVIGSQLSYLMSGKGCGCTSSLEATLQGSVLTMSLYEHNSILADSRMELRVTKQ